MKVQALCILLVAICGAMASAQASRWVEVARWSGCGMLQTQELPFIGEEWKVKYTSKSQSPCTVEMLDKSGTPIATLLNYKNLQGPWTASGDITPSMAKAYLKIDGNKYGWTLVLEQYVDDIAGFNIHKFKKENSKYEAYGAWTGEGGDEISIPVNIPSKNWRLTMNAFEPGCLFVEAHDAAGNCLLNNFIINAGTAFSWFHQEGDFVIKASSIATPWTMTIELF